ncbi:hypothetical protein ACJX0J_007033, partial [Zea mays]
DGKRAVVGIYLPRRRPHLKNSKTNALGAHINYILEQLYIFINALNYIFFGWKKFFPYERRGKKEQGEKTHLQQDHIILKKRRYDIDLNGLAVTKEEISIIARLPVFTDSN